MRSSTRGWALLFGAALALSFIAIILSRKDNGPSHIGASTPGPQAENLLAPDPPPLSAPHDLARAEAAAPIDVPPPLEVVAATLELAREHAGNEVDIASKYAGRERGELLVALDRLMPIHTAERERLIKERWDLGIYDTQFVPEGQYPPPPTLPDGTRPSFGFISEPSAGGAIVKTTMLAPDEYPDFSALEREVTWLRRAIGPQSRRTEAK